jgi:hypothetical protein
MTDDIGGDAEFLGILRIPEFKLNFRILRILDSEFN